MVLHVHGETTDTCFARVKQMDKWKKGVWTRQLGTQSVKTSIGRPVSLVRGIAHTAIELCTSIILDSLTGTQTLPQISGPFFMSVSKQVWRAIDCDPLVTTKAEEMESLPPVDYHLTTLLSPYSDTIKYRSALPTLGTLDELPQQ